MRSVLSNSVRVLGHIFTVLSTDEKIDEIDHAKYRTFYYPFTPKK